MTLAPLAVGEAEKGCPLHLDPVCAFVELWRTYSTGIRPTSLGSIYGAKHAVDTVDRLLSARSADNRIQRGIDENAFRTIVALYRGERITVSPTLELIIIKSMEHRYHGNSDRT